MPKSSVPELRSLLAASVTADREGLRAGVPDLKPLLAALVTAGSSAVVVYLDELEEERTSRQGPPA